MCSRPQPEGLCLWRPWPALFLQVDLYSPKNPRSKEDRQLELYNNSARHRRQRLIPQKLVLIAAQRLNARQEFALEPFEEGAAGSRYIGEIVINARLIERCDRIAAAG